jgi:hypothetical protein
MSTCHWGYKPSGIEWAEGTKSQQSCTLVALRTNLVVLKQPMSEDPALLLVVFVSANFEYNRRLCAIDCLQLKSHMAMHSTTASTLISCLIC